MTILLRALAPYFAVLVFWVWCQNGWLAILAYHAQIVWWAFVSKPFRETAAKEAPRKTGLAYAALLAGPVVWLLLPGTAAVEVGEWLREHRLSGMGMLLMIPYFGLVHPLLEQRHWAPLRERSWMAHPLFAGYHAIVLYDLLPGLVLALTFLALTGVSLVWEYMRRTTGNLHAVRLSHVFADTGIVLAAWLMQ